MRAKKAWKMSGLASILAVLLLTFGAAGVWAEEEEIDKPQKLVDKALETFNRFESLEDIPWFHKNIKNAKAIFIIPTLVKAGVLIGGSGGTGAALARDAGTGEWSYPAFYTVGSISLGLQIGVAGDEIVGLVMTEKGMEKMFYSAVKLGTDVSVAAGPTGAGAGAAAADVVTYSRSKGAFVGVVLDGAVVSSRDGWNTAYYGEGTTPMDILQRQRVSNPQADPLRLAVAGAASE